jgi:predicted aspartyl protease
VPDKIAIILTGNRLALIFEVVIDAMRTLRLLNALLFVGGAVTSAHAEAICPPAELFTSVDMKLGDDGRIYVPVKVDQFHKWMMVDTGGFFSVVTTETADQLKLPTRHTRFEIIGVSGDSTSVAAHTSFSLGNLYANSVDFMVAPDAGGFADDVGEVAGILAPNLLHSYDVEIDFANMKFSLYSQDHCDGKAVPWPANTVSIIPVKLDTSNHITLPVTLDGRNLTAIFDTGAIHTVIDLDLAQSGFGLKPGDTNTPEMGRLLRSPETKTYFHRFQSLSMDGIVIANPTVRLIPDLMRNKMGEQNDSMKGGSRLPPPASAKAGFGDLILGMSVLRQWHMYIAYKEQAIYLSPSPVVISMEPIKVDDQPAAVQGQQRPMMHGAAGMQPH